MSPALRLRRHLSAVFQGLAAKIALALVVSTAGALCFLPGFDALNYYSSLALGLLGSLVAGVACAVRTTERRARRHTGSLRGEYGRNALFAVYLAVASAVPLLINTVRVKNCNLSEGLLFFAVGAVFSVVFSSQVGTACGLLRAPKRAWLAGAFFIAAFVAWVVWDLLHLYLHPPIFAYNPFSGFFSGAIYDDLIELDSRLLLYRLNNVAQLGLLWSSTALLADETLWLRGRQGNRAPRANWALLGLFVLVVSGFFGARGALGYEMSRADIANTLGGRIGNPKITLIYDRASIDDATAALLLEDHTFRRYQLENLLGETPGVITSFIYADNAQKRTLMGAGRVFIAKPWLAEIHIARVPYATPVVHHELAHVVLGHFADSFLKVPTTIGFVPHNALVEGAAEAMEWYGGQLTAHQWAAAMRKEGIAPDLASIVGADGFWKQSAGKAYTVAGSFIRWLLDTRGAEPLKAAYRDGDFEVAYGESLDSLTAGWGAFVDTQVSLPPEALALARQRFSRKGVLMRVCPLEVPRLEAQANAAMSRGDVEESLALRRTVVDWVPGSVSKRLTLLLVLSRQGRLAEARKVHSEILAVEALNAAAGARADALLADAIWRSGDAVGAHTLYGTVVAAPLSENHRRNIAAKHRISGSQELEPVLGPYLLGASGDDAEAISYLMEASVDLPDEPMVAYLAGRRMASAGQSVAAVTMLLRSLRLWPRVASAVPLKALVVRETYRLLGKTYFFLGQLDEAEAAFERVVALAAFDSDRLTWRDWLERVAWKRTH